MGSNHLSFNVTNLSNHCYTFSWSLLIQRYCVWGSSPCVYRWNPSSLIFNGIFFWYKTSEVPIFNSQAYQLPESPSNGIPNLYSGMVRAAHFRRWCGEGKGRSFFYTVMKAPHPPVRHSVWYSPTGRNTLAPDCPFPIWQHYPVRPRQRGAQGDQDRLRNSHLSFSCKALTDT